MSQSNSELLTPRRQNEESLLNEKYSDFVTPKPFPSGTVICDVNHVIHQARKIEKHTTECNFGGTMIFDRTTRCGLVHTFYYTCSHKLCDCKEKIVTDKEKKALNNLAVLGAMATGNGFSQEEQKFSMMDMSYMTKKTYASCEKTSGDVVQAFAVETMEASIEEEKKIAESRGDIDEDGYHNICVIVDGGWCKRSYGHGYNSSSGVSVLIGEETKKILFLNNRNKVCYICTSNENNPGPPKIHSCSKNWNGPSTAMESDIIVQGLIFLEKNYNIRCIKIVGDGDANLMKKVKENVPYGNKIRKIECANHAVRRYFRALDRLQKNSTKFQGIIGRQSRKNLAQRMSRLVIGAREAIKTFASKTIMSDAENKVQDLVKAFLNGPAHVFGKHDSCGDFCKRKQETNLNAYEVMAKSGLLTAISEEIQRILVANAHTLIYNATNNPAEVYMSQFCKTVGGKRIDFSKGFSVERRANVAALAYQHPSSQWQKKCVKYLTGYSPKSPHNKYLLRKQKMY